MRTKNKEQIHSIQQYDNKQRLSRPLGFTNLKQTNTNKQSHNRFIVLHYINNNNTICGQYLTTEQLSFLLNITPYQLSNIYYKLIKQLGIHFKAKDGGKHTLEALLAGSQKMAMTIQGRIHEQLGLMLTSQGDTYKAFVTSEYHKLLQLGINSSKHLGETAMMLAKYLYPEGPTNVTQIHIQNNGIQQGPQGNQAINITEALRLLDAHNPSLLPAGELDSDVSPIDLGEVPEVDARKQYTQRHLTRREDMEDADILPAE